MNRKTDVIVIGSGLAGLMAACAAASQGVSVRVLSRGRGSLAISPGCIDVLGYGVDGSLLKNPFAAFSSLPASHPYAILGETKVREALAKLVELCDAAGLKLRNVNEENSLVPTVMGTLKPSWLVQDDPAHNNLEQAKKILIVTIQGYRDCRPHLVSSQLKRYPKLADKEFGHIILPDPFPHRGRSLSALDLAHVADREKGCQWLMEQLKDKGNAYDLALLPPMLGARSKSKARDAMAENLGCPWVEMLTIPPGVAGLRIYDALASHLHAQGIDFFENSEVVSSETKDDLCVSLKSASAGAYYAHEPKAVVLATGGVMTGGINLSPDKALESVFGIDIPVPEKIEDWTNAEIFAKQPISAIGLSVDEKLRPLNSKGDAVLKNVFVAGRTIGGYDFTLEKSGHGVSCATGWHAGLQAAASVNEASSRGA